MSVIYMVSPQAPITRMESFFIGNRYFGKCGDIGLNFHEFEKS